MYCISNLPKNPIPDTVQLTHSSSCDERSFPPWHGVHRGNVDILVHSPDHSKYLNIHEHLSEYLFNILVADIHLPEDISFICYLLMGISWISPSYTVLYYLLLSISWIYPRVWVHVDEYSPECLLITYLLMSISWIFPHIILVDEPFPEYLPSYYTSWCASPWVSPSYLTCWWVSP